MEPLLPGYKPVLKGVNVSCSSQWVSTPRTSRFRVHGSATRTGGYDYIYNGLHLVDKTVVDLFIYIYNHYIIAVVK